MPRRETARRIAALVAAIALLPACARRTDDAMRRAWEESAGRGAQGGAGADPNGNGDHESSAPRVAFGWARVDEMLVQAVDLLAIGPDDTQIARLAERWCTVVPEPHATHRGPVRVCHPSPPVRLEGHTMVLEMGAPGIIGLVARDLTEAQSVALSERARTAATRLCTGDWEPAPVVTERDGRLREEFHMCTALGGPVLAVGRARVFDRDDNRMEQGPNVWQVSVAVLGTT